MQSTKVLFLIFAVLLSNALHSQEFYQKNYSNDDEIIGRSLSKAGEDGFIISLDYSNSDSIGMIRVNYIGDTLWTREFDSDRGFFPSNVYELNDGGFLLQNAINIDSTWGLQVIKTDQDGEIQWINVILRIGAWGLSTCQVNDGNIFLTGNEGPYVWVTKISNIGNLIWSRKYYGLGGGTIHDMDPQTKIIKTYNNRLIISNSTSTSEINELNAFIFEIDFNGNIIWGKILGGSNMEAFRSVIETIDHGYMAAGYTNSFGSGGEDVFLVKFDSVGNILWSRIYGTNLVESCYAISELPNGDVILLGNYGIHTLYYKGFILKITSSGDLIWSTVTDKDIRFLDIAKSNDYRFGITGLEKDTSGKSQAFLILTDSSGILCENSPYPLQVTSVYPDTSTYFSSSNMLIETSSVQVTEAHISCEVSTVCLITYQDEIGSNPESILTICPNPFSASTRVFINKTCNITLDLYLINSMGYTVKLIRNIDSGSINIYRENLSSGLYFIQIKDQERILESKKILIL